MKKDSWQMLELKNHLDNYKNDVFLDSRNIFLTNPANKAKIDEVFQNYAWPAIIRTLSGTPIRLFHVGDEDPLLKIEDLRHEYATRALLFVLEDKNNPLRRDSTSPWYFRGEIRCSALDYMISSDFHLYLPPIIGIDNLLNLLKDPAFNGYPPTLSFEFSYKKQESWIVEFHSGSGAGWGITSYQQFSDHVRKEILKALKLIEATYRLEEDYSNIMAFIMLRNVLRETYGTNIS